MHRLRALAVCLLLGLSSCEEPRFGIEEFSNRFQLTGFSLSNTTPVAGNTVTATINYIGVSGPFSFTITFDDCVTPAVHNAIAPNGTTSAQLEFTLDEFTTAEHPDGKDCVITVTGVDANGSVGGPIMGTFHVEGSDA